MEDLDPPREVPGSADQIIATLDAFGFEWTESILRQSSRREAYDAAVDQLLAQGLAFPCSCTRAELQAAQPRVAVSAASDELHYPGWCRNGPRVPNPTAIRARVSAGQITFVDAIQGTVRVDVSAEVGDFVIRRRDQLHAYQLAVVVDDSYQRITDVVRGADLLHSTARQMILQRSLGLPAFMYAHLPVASDANGIKLSKSAGSAAIDVSHPARELWRALRFLRQAPPPDLCRAGLATIWEWALQHWHLQPLFGLRQAAIEVC